MSNIYRGGTDLEKFIICCLSLIVVLGLGWIISFTSEQQGRSQVLNEFYTVITNSSLENNENPSQVAYEKIKFLLSEDSTVDFEKISLILEPNVEDLSRYLVLNTANISYEVGKEHQVTLNKQSGFSIPVTIIVDGILTDLVEEKEINKQKIITTHIFFTEIDNEWKVLDFDYIDDEALLAF